MQLLLLEGVNLDCPTDRGRPLFLAPGNRREEAVKYLLILSWDGLVDLDSRTVSRHRCYGRRPGKVMRGLCSSY